MVKSLSTCLPSWRNMDRIRYSFFPRSTSTKRPGVCWAQVDTKVALFTFRGTTRRARESRSSCAHANSTCFAKRNCRRRNNVSLSQVRGGVLPTRTVNRILNISKSFQFCLTMAAPSQKNGHLYHTIPFLNWGEFINASVRLVRRLPAAS
jgi:hypothetical protein